MAVQSDHSRGDGPNHSAPPSLDGYHERWASGLLLGQFILLRSKAPTEKTPGAVTLVHEPVGQLSSIS